MSSFRTFSCRASGRVDLCEESVTHVPSTNSPDAATGSAYRILRYATLTVRRLRLAGASQSLVTLLFAWDAMIPAGDLIRLADAAASPGHPGEAGTAVESGAGTGEQERKEQRQKRLQPQRPSSSPSTHRSGIQAHGVRIRATRPWDGKRSNCSGS